MVHVWSIWLACLSLWIWFTRHFPNAQNSQPWIHSSGLWSRPFVLIPIRLFQPINIELILDCCSLLEFIHFLGSVPKCQVEWRWGIKSLCQKRVRLGRQISWHLRNVDYHESKVSQRWASEAKEWLKGSEIWGEGVRRWPGQRVMRTHARGRSSEMFLADLVAFFHPVTRIIWIHLGDTVTPIVSIWAALLSLWFPQSSNSKYHAARSFRSCNSLLRDFKTAPRPQLAVVFATQSFGMLASTATRPVSPCPCALLASARCHPQCPLPHHLGNEPSLSISCPEWLSETCWGAFYWCWEIGKHLNFSCTKILLFPLKWLFKYTRLISAQMEVWKCM